MVQIIKKISLEVSKPNLIQAIVAKQYDNNSRFLQVTLMHEGKKIEIAPTSTVIINAKRTDGEEKPFAGEANNDGTATVPLTYWMLELEGEVWCDVSVIDTEGRKLTSTKFDLLVERASCKSGEITEDENYDILVRLIEDVNKAKPDLEYDPESENAQSGKAVAQALSGVSGVKYITETVEAHKLEDGIYIIDGENGGELQFACEEAFLGGFSCLQNGFVSVAYDNKVYGKKFFCFSTEEVLWHPILFTTTLDEEGNSIADTTDIYVSKKYVDEQIVEVKAMINEASALIGGAE